MTINSKVCKDCLAEGKKKPYRKAPFPGPRCTTHHRAIVRKRKKDTHEKRVQEIYRLEPGQYDELYAIQNKKCAICKRATGARKRLAVDHDHKTGKVRGLLCGPCNKMLGMARDDINFFLTAIEYLNTNPYDMLIRDNKQENK